MTRMPSSAGPPATRARAPFPPPGPPDHAPGPATGLSPGVATAQWVIGLLAAATAIALSIAARLPLPYRDDWALLLGLLAGPSWAGLFVPHNEHVIPVVRLLLTLQYRLEGSNGYTMLFAALASLAVVAALTLGEIRRRWPDDTRLRRWTGGVALTVLFFAWQLQSMVFPTAIVFPLVEMFAVTALVSLLNATEPGAPRRALWMAAAALASLGAILTTTNGLAVPIMLAMVAVGRRAGWRVILAFLLMGIIGGAAYLVTVLAGPVRGSLAFDHMPSPVLVLAFFLAFYSSLIAQASSVAGVLIGTLLFASGVAIVLTVTVRGPRRPRLEHFAVGLLLFTMAAAALAAPTRADFGIVQVAQSRYASFVLPFWAALMLAGASCARGEWLRRLAAPAVVVSAAALMAHLGIGVVWIAKADNVATAGLALNSGAQDDEWVRTLYPVPEVLYDIAARLRAAGDRSLGPTLPAVPAGWDAAATCAGEMRWTAVPEGSGLRMSGTTTESSASGLIVDHGGRTVGLARPAPIAAAPNPSPMDVARAVGHALLSPSARAGTWIGFAGADGGGPGDGAPYTLVLLGPSLTPACRVLIAGP